MAQGRNNLTSYFNTQLKLVQQRLASTKLSPLQAPTSSMTFSATNIDIHVELTGGSLDFNQDLHGNAAIVSNEILSIDLLACGSLEMLERHEGHFKPHLHVDIPHIELDLTIRSGQEDHHFHRPVNARIKSDDHHLNIVLHNCDIPLFGKNKTPLDSQPVALVNSRKSST